MQVIIVGAGKVGFNLAARLSSEGHDVIIVDEASERIDLVSEKLDVQGVHGNGASPRLLQRLGARETDLLVAVTNVDEVNILSCELAKQMGTKKTVARLRDIDYASDPLLLNNDVLGVDLFINPERVTATVISDLIMMPEADSVNFFEQRKIVLVELTVKEDNPLIGKALHAIRSEKPYLITAIRRDGAMLIPDGNDTLQLKDSLYVITKTEDLRIVEESLGFERPKIDEVMILGGGRLGYYLAKELEPTDIHVKVVEKNLARCEWLADLLDNTIILHGDASDIDLLQEEGVRQVDILITATEDDKLNVLVSLLGSRLGAKRTVTQIRRSDYLPLIESVGIDVAISPRLLTDEAILRFTRHGDFSSIAIIETGAAEAFEVEISEEHKEVVHHALRDIELPRGAIVATIYRGETVFIPRGDDVIVPGDHVILFVVKDQVRRVEKLFH